MAQNYLQLNNSKSEIIPLNPPNPITQIERGLGTWSINVKPIARNLGVLFKQTLTFKPQKKK